MDQPLSAPELERIGSAVDDVMPRYLADLERLVDIDCGTYTKSGVDEVGSIVAERFEALGAAVVRHPHPELGDTLVATLESPAPGPTVVMTGHLDTVFEAGTVAQRPYAAKDGRATGPGVHDMKGGLLAGIHALAALRSLAGAAEWLPVGRLVFVANADEEIGSPSSTPIIEAAAADADVALVLEGARANGDFVSSRKGLMHARIDIRGRAAHAGVEPHKGRSALLEAAHKTIALHGLNDRWDDVSVNVGVMRGGTRPNIVAEAASLTLDLRASERQHMEAAQAAIDGIREASTVPDVTTTMDVLARFPPMERSPSAADLIALTVALAADLGIETTDTATGGASDANTTAAMGIPTIDGLGPVGGGDHALDEFIDLDSVAPRMTLLAALLVAIGRRDQRR